MMEHLARRGFLRGLAALPMVGGAVTLIGRPTAAAVPISDALQERYTIWLAHEHRAAVREHRYRQAFAHVVAHPGGTETPHEHAARCLRDNVDYIGWIPEAPEIERLVTGAPSSTRAAVVLAAVGCDLIER